jgi:hypothetical protein
MSHDSQEAPQLVDAWTVFVDIVGFKALAECPGGNPSEPLAALQLLGGLGRKERVRPTHFFRLSDSAVFVVPVRAETEREPLVALNTAYIWAREVQTTVLEKGLLLRGGLTRGRIYCDESRNTVFGPALNKAYSLESTRAVVPRIVVDRDVIPENWGPLRDLIHFGDGLSFINYLFPVPLDPMGVSPLIDGLRQHRAAVMKLVNISSSRRSLAKCNYLVTFHNALLSWLQRFIDRLNEPTRTELRARAEELRIGGFELVPALLLAGEAEGI